MFDNYYAYSFKSRTGRFRRTWVKTLVCAKIFDEKRQRSLRSLPSVRYDGIFESRGTLFGLRLEMEGKGQRGRAWINHYERKKWRELEQRQKQNNRSIEDVYWYVPISTIHRKLMSCERLNDLLKMSEPITKLPIRRIIVTSFRWVNTRLIVVLKDTDTSLWVFDMMLMLQIRIFLKGECCKYSILRG